MSENTPWNPEGPFNVVLVDDHPITRQGMQMLLGESEFNVVGEADDSVRAVQIIGKLQPEIAIVDVSLKAENGIEVIKRLKVVAPKTRILVVSMHDENVYGERALRAGASGYLMKGEAAEKLIEALRSISAGNVYISDTMRESMLNRYVGGRSANPSPALKGLTDREMEIMELLGNGFSSREVAGRLNLAVKTVDTHREHLKKKLNLHSSADLLRFAIDFVWNGGALEVAEQPPAPRVHNGDTARSVTPRASAPRRPD